jgi:5,10-methylenetetrahydromethanopterin reductase
MRISCAFPPVPDTPAHIELAGKLGYHTAWVYDTPALQIDVWMTLALAAVRTTRITLGPGVMIPSLRHPMVTASAIAHLVSLVGQERVVIGVGTGFTGRRAMGQKPLKWADMPAHVESVKALLRGETIEVEGRKVKMLHGVGQAPQRPIDVRFVLGVNGPKGLDTAAGLDLGVFTSRPRADASYARVPSATLLGFGTVIGQDETIETERVWEAAGAPAAVGYHAFLEQNDERLESLPNADKFLTLARAIPEDVRHLVLHEGHLTVMNPIDRQVVTPQAAAMLSPLTGTVDQVRAKVESLANAGMTEIAFQPDGRGDGPLDVARPASTMANGLFHALLGVK